ncbi:hypothetical protein [Paenarthrobacter sp. YAF11_1]|uniref:hypothetical protein n=1 Tax=Paenarthrobacter sp. YAF11_1 TaxID=3233074 RepID=UPI003F98A59F
MTATSTTWTMRPCPIVISPSASTAQGSYRWASDSNITGAVTAANATYPRKDILYIQVSDSSSGDGSGALSAPVLYLAGTPGADPQAPDLPVRSFLVATITVPQVGGGSPTVVRNPATFVAAGGIQPVSGTTEQAALTPYEGLRIDRTDLDLMVRYNGTRWVGGRAAITLDPLYVARGAGTAAPRVCQNSDGDVIMEGVLQRASGTLTMLANNPYPIGTIPEGYRPAEERGMLVQTSTGMGGWGRIRIDPGTGVISFETPVAFTGLAAASAVIWLDSFTWTTP